MRKNDYNANICAGRRSPALTARVNARPLNISRNLSGSRMERGGNRMESVIAEHITKTAGVCGGKACIAGHRIRVWDIVVQHAMRGASDEEILAMFPGISLGDLHAALAYYFDNREEMNAENKREEELADSLRSRFPSKLQEKLGG